MTANDCLRFITVGFWKMLLNVFMTFIISICEGDALL